MLITNVQQVETLLACDSIPGVSSVRNVLSLVGSGSVSSSSSEYILNTGTTNGSVARLSTAERSRVTPGSDVYAQIGIRVPGVPTGTQLGLWGLFDDNEGFGFGQDATNFFIFLKTAGTLYKVYKTNWNIDKLDATGPSGLNLPNGTGGLLFQLRATWYGGIEFSLYRPEGGTEQVNVHRSKSQEPMWLNPYLPLRAEIYNNTTTTSAFQVALSVRKISQVSSGKASCRSVNSFVNGVSVPVTTANTPTPIIGLKRNASGIPVNLSAIEIMSDQPLLGFVANGSGLTSPTWGGPTSIPGGESVCTVTTSSSATALPANAVQYSFLVPSGFSTHTFDPALMGLVESYPSIIYLFPIGSSSATVNVNLRWHEQW